MILCRDVRRIYYRVLQIETYRLMMGNPIAKGVDLVKFVKNICLVDMQLRGGTHLIRKYAKK